MLRTSLVPTIIKGGFRSNRIAPHQGIKQAHHLARLPDVLALDCGKDEVTLLDAADGFSDRDLWQIPHGRTLALGARVLMPSSEGSRDSNTNWNQ